MPARERSARRVRASATSAPSDLAGRRVRRLQLPGALGTTDSACDYDVDAATFLPVRLACSAGRALDRRDDLRVRPRRRGQPRAALARRRAPRRDARAGSERHPRQGRERPRRRDRARHRRRHGGQAVPAGDDRGRHAPGRGCSRSRSTATSRRASWRTAPAGCRRRWATDTRSTTPQARIGAICQHYGDSGSAVRETPAGSALRAARGRAGTGRVRLHRGTPSDGRRARRREPGLREPEPRSVPREPAEVQLRTAKWHTPRVPLGR